MGKRVKITFTKVNEGKIQPISREAICQTNARVAAAMKKELRKRKVDG